MTKQESVPRNFRASPENSARIRYAIDLGINVSEIINRVLDRHLKKEVESEVQKLRRRLDGPVP